MSDLRTSPVHPRHQALAATMTDFGGWLMPLDYGSVLAEHRAVRESCGVFDVSHLGRILVRGPGADHTIGAVLTNDIAGLAEGKSHYTLCLNEDGGIVDDVFVYRLGGNYSDGVMVVPNAANMPEVLARLQAAATGDTEVSDIQDQLACLAVQGPQAAQVVEAVGIPVERFAYLDCYDLAGHGVIARTGYTGERGYEIFPRCQDAPILWDRLVAAGATPAGLGSRDTLRLEMGYPLHGNDIGPQRSPVEAGLGWAIKGAHEFTGRAAYEAAKAVGPTQRLRGLRIEGRGIPRAHCTVWQGDQQVGETTSGTFSPTLGIGIAMGYLDAAITVGDMVEIEVRGKRLPAQVVSPPFVDRNPRTP